MAIVWRSEACDLAPDHVSGAKITRLTQAAFHSTNLYYEQPYGTPDGRRIAYGRSLHDDPRHPPNELGVIDLVTLKRTGIDSDIASVWFATSPWSGKLHYLRTNGELIRVDLTTLEKEIVLTHWPIPMPCTLWSVTPDMRYLLTGRRSTDLHTEVVRVDLDTGSYEVVFRRREIISHMQINHVDGRSILIQVNRGRCVNQMGQLQACGESPEGATHIVVDLFTGAEQSIPVGEPYTGSSTGHASWVAGTGRMITPVQWPGMRVDFLCDEERPAHDPRHPQGNLVFAGPDDETPTIFPAQDHLFQHSSASRCGRYFVADCVCHGIPGKVEVVAGRLDTGKCRVLVSDTGATMGGPACSHVHPYLTADNTQVIYNADPHSLGQVYKATVPAGFWESLGPPENRKSNPL